MTTSPTELARVDEGPPSPAGRYLRDIAAVTLLTAEQETELARLIEAGKRARRLMKHGADLPEANRAALEEAVTQGEQARRQLMEANLRLVVSVARKYLKREVGLARAVEKYDWPKGYRFSTYAHWWIRQGMTRAISRHGRPIHVPTHVVAAPGEVYKAARDLQQELGRERRLTIESAAHSKLRDPKVRNKPREYPDDSLAS